MDAFLRPIVESLRRLAPPQPVTAEQASQEQPSPAPALQLPHAANRPAAVQDATAAVQDATGTREAVTSGAQALHSTAAAAGKAGVCLSLFKLHNVSSCSWAATYAPMECSGGCGA